MAKGQNSCFSSDLSHYRWIYKFHCDVKMSLQVVRDVSGQSVGPEEARSPVVPRKNELDKVSVVERMNKFPCYFNS